MISTVYEAGQVIGAVSIGIGLLVNVLFIEVIGITAGGMVVPGYIALNLNSPFRVTVTVLIGLLTFFCVRGLSNFFLIFGKRFLLFCILIGFTLTVLCNHLVQYGFQYFHLTNGDSYFLVIGFIVPGLIAYWMERQGVLKTLFGMIVGATLTRLLLALVIESGISIS